jgi:hypothetical protein
MNLRKNFMQNSCQVLQVIVKVIQVVMMIMTTMAMILIRQQYRKAEKGEARGE